MTTPYPEKLVGELRALMEKATDALETALAERDEARSIVRDIHWMAQRYADGRKSYAVGLYNDAIIKAISWCPDVKSAVDGMAPEYQSRADALTAAHERIAALETAFERHSRHDGLCAIIGGYGYCTCGLDKDRAALQTDGGAK